MNDWSDLLIPVGQGALSEMEKDHTRKVTVNIYDYEGRPWGVVVVERKSFDPWTGD